MKYYASKKITKHSIHKRINDWFAVFGLQNTHDMTKYGGTLKCKTFNDDEKCKIINHYHENTLMIVEPKDNYKYALCRSHYVKNISPNLESKCNRIIDNREHDNFFLDNLEKDLEELFEKRIEKKKFVKQLNFYKKCKYLAKSSINKINRIYKIFAKNYNDTKDNRTKDEKKEQIDRIKALLDKY